MKSEKGLPAQAGFILPLLALGLLVVLGGVLYFYTKHENTTSAVTTTTTVYTGTSANTGSYTAPSPVPVKTTVYTSGTVAGNAGNPSLVQTSSQGVLPQRLGWQTYTNIDYSYAISRPYNWLVSGASSFVSLSDGRAMVSIQSYNILSGTNPVTFATQNGATGGFVTTKINAYTALQDTEGGNTVYYIVNGAVGYKISVTNNLTADEAAVVRAMLIEFTVTKQR